MSSSLDIAPTAVSSRPSQDQDVRRATRLLAMVHELHKTGRQKLRICPGYSYDMSQWRCAITTSDNVAENGWTPETSFDRVSYPSEGEYAYFMWADAPGKDARALAAMFLERFPGICASAVGRDWAYAGWFTEMLGAAESGRLPVFYSGIELRPVEGTIFPPPNRTPVKNQRKVDSIFRQIANDDLKLSDLPLGRPTDMEKVWNFCLSYDGYAGGLRTIDDCLAIAQNAERKGLGQCSMDELRITAFIRLRQIKHADQGTPPPGLINSIQHVVEELRARFEGL